MPVLRVKTEEGDRRICARRGETVAEALLRGGFTPSLPCAGEGRCGRCRAEMAGLLSPCDEAERAAGARLMCRARIEGDCEVLLPVPDMKYAGARDAGGGTPFYERLGAALDIGTTTLSLRFSDGGGGDALNPQAVYGADVVSRVSAAAAGKGAELSALVRGAIESLLGDRRPDAMVITGNTAMLCLLAGEDVTGLSQMPFLAPRLFGEMLSARELGLSFDARCYIPRCIGAYVGADTNTALLACGMVRSEKTAMLADLGTNAEAAICKNGELWCCSAAAGPAFEGAGLECGSPAFTGAVEHVKYENGRFRVETVGGAPARSIAGSGALDALAAALDAGIMGRGGEIAGNIELAENIFMTQKDVRALQLAKGAVRAGMDTLMLRAGVALREIESFYIAGGFSGGLDVHSAVKTGLIAPPLGEVAVIAGNAALTGALMLLGSTELMKTSEETAETARVVELAADEDFARLFVENMEF